MQVFDQEFLAATEGELYLGAKSWCLANTSSETEALKLFLDKFVAKITPEYMSQRDFLTCVANDAFLGQVNCWPGNYRSYRFSFSNVVVFETIVSFRSTCSVTGRSR